MRIAGGWRLDPNVRIRGDSVAGNLVRYLSRDMGESQVSLSAFSCKGFTEYPRLRT